MTDTDKHPEKPPRCPVCHGRGYLVCDCWPGDCICGYGDEECEYCQGHGEIHPDDDDPGYDWESEA